MVFTFITSKEGSIDIEQFVGEDLRTAAQRWYHKSRTDPGEPLDGMEDPTPVSTVERVWCISGTDPRGKFFWTHVVETNVDSPVEE